MATTGDHNTWRSNCKSLELTMLSSRCHFWQSHYIGFLIIPGLHHNLTKVVEAHLPSYCCVLELRKHHTDVEKACHTSLAPIASPEFFTRCHKSFGMVTNRTGKQVFRLCIKGRSVHEEVHGLDPSLGPPAGFQLSPRLPLPVSRSYAIHDISSSPANMSAHHSSYAADMRWTICGYSEARFFSCPGSCRVSNRRHWPSVTA